MEPAEDRMDVIDPGDLLCILHRVDDPGMGAAAQNDKALVPHVDDERLVVPDRVGHPAAIDEHLHSRHPLLERGLPLYLPGHEQVAGGESRGAAAQQDIGPGLLQRNRDRAWEDLRSRSGCSASGGGTHPGGR